MNNKGFQTQRKIVHKVFNAGRPSFPRNLGVLDNAKEGGGGGGGRGGGEGGGRTRLKQRTASYQPGVKCVPG